MKGYTVGKSMADVPFKYGQTLEVVKCLNNLIVDSSEAKDQFEMMAFDIAISRGILKCKTDEEGLLKYSSDEEIEVQLNDMYQKESDALVEKYKSVIYTTTEYLESIR